MGDPLLTPFLVGTSEGRRDTSGDLTRSPWSVPCDPTQAKTVVTLMKKPHFSCF